MEDEIFNNFAEALNEYLETQKVFIQNPQRMEDISSATEMACSLFPDANINLEDDPLQMGAVILAIEDFDLVVREPEKFVQVICKANNFEIIYKDNGAVRLAILFCDALTRV